MTKLNSTCQAKHSQTDVKTKNIVVLISGSGSNLQAFIDAQKRPDFNGNIRAVISNIPEAYGLTRAEQADIPAISIPHKDFESRESFDMALAKKIDSYEPDLIILAGFMRILTAEFVSKYTGKLLNIHPSLLPKYPGLHTHKNALEHQEKFHGTTVHFVTEELDGGPLIGHSKTEVLSDDTEDTLCKRIQALEHRLYPHIAHLFVNERLKLIKDTVYFDNAILEKVIEV